MAAMVADQRPARAMLDQPGRAVRALESVAAGAAQGQRRIAAPVEKQQRLLVACEILPHGLDEPRRNPFAARDAFAAAGRSPRFSAGPARRNGCPAGASRSAPGGRFRGSRSTAWRRPAQWRRIRAGRAPPPCRGHDRSRRPPACRPPRAPHRRRSARKSAKGRNSAERAPATTRTSPSAAPRQMRARRRGDRPECHSAGRLAESRGETFEKLRGERDFRHQDQGLAAVAQRLGDRLEIDFGLAGAGDAFQQDRLERPRGDRFAQGPRGFA